MCGRLAAKPAILVALKPLGCFLLVLTSRVIPAFTIAACQLYEFSHNDQNLVKLVPRYRLKIRIKSLSSLTTEITKLVGFPHLFEGILRLTLLHNLADDSGTYGLAPFTDGKPEFLLHGDRHDEFCFYGDRVTRHHHLYAFG